MKTVFVSGCYDIIHAGHLQFFKEARALGDHLTVCVASDDVLWAHKQRRPSLPQDHKLSLIRGFDVVDHVVLGENPTLGLDFLDHFRSLAPDILAVTEDDHFATRKQELCREVGATYVVLPKTAPQFTPVSSSGVVKWIRAPDETPLRVDFGGGWLDVPKFVRPGAFIVNCAISPTVSLHEWRYEKYSGLGGSGAWALLNGENCVTSELDLGVGWQDPACICETGLCVWKSGPLPRLYLKRDGELLNGKMALHYTGGRHDTPGAVDRKRNFDLIEKAGATAAAAVEANDLTLLAEAVNMSYEVQLDEGMNPLSKGESVWARKYCGSGFGGYALYLFGNTVDRDQFVASVPEALTIEPYLT